MGKVRESKLVYTQPSEGLWSISEVLYRGEKGTYELFENMTPAMSQDELAKLSEKEKKKGNPHLTDAPLIWAICTRGYELRGENPEVAEGLRNFLLQGFRKFPNTLTRVVYNPSQNDKIIHNCKTSDEYSLTANVVGPDSWIKEMSDKKILESLLGTQDVAKINEVSQWINETNSYFWRFNSKPSQEYERVVGFGAVVGGFNLDCDGGPLIECPAFRVQKVD